MHGEQISPEGLHNGHHVFSLWDASGWRNYMLATASTSVLFLRTDISSLCTGVLLCGQDSAAETEKWVLKVEECCQQHLGAFSDAASAAEHGTDWDESENQAFERSEEEHVEEEAQRSVSLDLRARGQDEDAARWKQVPSTCSRSMAAHPLALMSLTSSEASGRAGRVGGTNAGSERKAGARYATAPRSGGIGHSRPR